MVKCILKSFVLTAFLVSGMLIYGQDEMSLMHYNLLFYGNPFACNESNNNTDEKDNSLQIILQEVNPDILTVNELSSNEFYADRLLNEVLNVGTIPTWSRAETTNTSWDSGIVNMLYYQHGKYTLYDQQDASHSPSGTSLLRVIDMYTLYENNSALSGDTIFFNVLVAHLAASDEEMRLLQTEAAMAMVEANGPGNYIFSGDFNVDSSNEDEFQKLINYDSPDYNFFDPADALGTWHGNPSFSSLHSQSTRLSGNGCPSGGGMNDRFDLTLVNDEVMNGTSGLTYVTNSYRVFGNDGENFDQSLHISNNEDVSTNVAIALYTVSDHLPIITNYTFGEIVGIENTEREIDFNASLNETDLTLSFQHSDNYFIRILNIHGQVVFEKKNVDQITHFSLSNLPSSFYILSVVNLSNGFESHQTFIYNK